MFVFVEVVSSSCLGVFLSWSCLGMSSMLFLFISIWVLKFFIVVSMVTSGVLGLVWLLCIYWLIFAYDLVCWRKEYWLISLILLRRMI